jgi:DHA1 family bicyclomycin/chloramphenicol resistance-like MFS transporter
MRFGMRKLSFMATLAFTIIALLYTVLFFNSPNPSIYVLVAFLSAQFFCLGFMWGNFRSIAMEPIGHIAGIGAAINGFVSTIFAIPIATFIGEFVKNSVWPLFAGLAVCGLFSVLIFMLVRRKPRRMVTA